MPQAETIGGAVLVPVLPNNRFDEQALQRYLRGRIPDFGSSLQVRQFQGGFSNPTFHLQAGERCFVLRKKPPGVLLPSAHAVDREFKVMQALKRSDVPVPRMWLLCEDDSIIGTMFYVMDYVAGRVYTDRLLPGCTPEQRHDMYDSMNEVLVRLHRLDHHAMGLTDFGKPSGYLERQVARWSKQYLASRVTHTPAMDQLMQWLPKHLPTQAAASIVHGDYRIGNLVFHPTEPRVVAVLDWELSTIGHPFSDLAYCCSAYHLDGTLGFAGQPLPSLGIPTEAEFIDRYRQRSGRREIEDWTFFIVFSLFRSAAIFAGVYKRAIDGQGVDERMKETKEIYENIAAQAWMVASART